jgi:hypothetical protein
VDAATHTYLAVRSRFACIVAMVVLVGCTLPLPGRHCDAPTVRPNSQPAEIGVENTPTCRGVHLDFDAQLWFPKNQDDVSKICRPGDKVVLLDPKHIQYTTGDGSTIAFLPPVREQRLGCA